MVLLPVSALAANEPHPTLDAIATELSSAPASVWCETNRAGWQAVTAAAGLTPAQRGFVRWTLEGPLPVAYLSPGVCVTLRERLAHSARPPSPMTFGPALLTLLHESVPLRGVRDEGVADCTALTLVKEYATRFFGYPEQVARTKRLVHWRWVTREGRRVRLRVVRRVRVLVRNPALADMYAGAFADHRLKPPEYQGC